jgi:asparagine synthase (glutamine-hydrolysing)
MSAIVGIFYPDGRPVDRMDLGRMVASVAHRGPDGEGMWSQGAIGLGHRMLRTTPESVREPLPLVNQSGDLVLTADARLDNRAELLAALDPRHHVSQDLADSHLILAAYEKWGNRCPEQLLGDFAFVVWDQHNQELFCARDHFGVRPFHYYYRTGQIFAFASEIKALLCLQKVPKRLNEARVADYLASALDDKCATFYQSILRLPPAHSLLISRRGIQSWSYWSLASDQELRLSSDEEYAGAFREVFTRAVQCRLRSDFPVGSQLSGGLDSSAGTCVARELLAEQGPSPLHMFSSTFDDLPQCDERPFIHAILAQGGLIPHYVRADQSGPLTDLNQVFWHQDEPSIGPNHFLPWGLNRKAQQEGIRIVLDGFDGDTTVSHGGAYFAELARQSAWNTFAAEARMVSQHFDVSPQRLLQYYAFPYLDELARRWRWMSFVVEAQRISRHFEVSRRHLLAHHGLKHLVPGVIGQLWQVRRPYRQSEPRIDPIINPSFARRIGLTERLHASNGFRAIPPLSAREEQWRRLTSGLFTLVLELSDRCAAAFSLEARHPFMDKRLIEFCLALPSEQKLHQGWSRIVMQRALADVLPEQVRWRGGKTDMNPNFARGLLIFDQGLLDKVVAHSPGCVERYVDTEVLHEVYQRLIAQETVTIDDALTVWKVVTLGQWLQYSKPKP